MNYLLMRGSCDGNLPKDCYIRINVVSLKELNLTRVVSKPGHGDPSET